MKIKKLVCVSLKKDQIKKLKKLYNASSEMRIAIDLYIQSVYERKEGYEEYYGVAKGITDTQDTPRAQYSFYLSEYRRKWCKQNGINISGLARVALDTFFIWQYLKGTKGVNVEIGARG